MLSGTAYFLRDDGMTILRADKQVYDLIGYEEEEMEDFYENQLLQAVAIEDYEIIRNFIASSCKDEEIFFRVIEKDGSYKKLGLKAHALEPGTDYDVIHEDYDVMQGELYEAD